MKTIAFAIAASLAALASPAAADAPKACIQADLVDHTHTVTTSQVLFYMRGGKVWQNDLPQACRGLSLHGFAVLGHNSEICGGSGISVIETGEVCTLGNKFSAYQPPVSHPAP